LVHAAAVRESCHQPACTSKPYTCHTSPSFLQIGEILCYLWNLPQVGEGRGGQLGVPGRAGVAACSWPASCTSCRQIVGTLAFPPLACLPTASDCGAPHPPACLQHRDAWRQLVNDRFKLNVQVGCCVLGR